MNRRTIAPTIAGLAAFVAAFTVLAAACTTATPVPTLVPAPSVAPKPAQTPGSSPVMLGDIADLLVLRMAKPERERRLHGHRARRGTDPVRPAGRHHLARLAHARLAQPRRRRDQGPGDGPGGRRPAGPHRGPRRVAPADDRHRQAATGLSARREHARARGGLDTGAASTATRTRFAIVPTGRLEGAPDRHARRLVRLRRPLARRPLAVPPRVPGGRRPDPLPGPPARRRHGRAPGRRDRGQAQHR